MPSPPDRTEIILPWTRLPFNMRLIVLIIITHIKHFSNYCLNFVQYDLYLFQIILWEFTTIINLRKVLSLWEKLKERKLAEKKQM